MVYLFAETEEDRSRLRRELHGFAKGYYDSLTCVTVDPLEFPELHLNMGLEPGVFPSGAVHQLSKDRIYPYPRNLPVDSQSLQKWGLDVWQGRVKPWARPGATTLLEDPSPTKRAKRKVSLANIPGVTIRVGGRDEL
jgi:protein disulfide-isomerase A1